MDLSHTMESASLQPTSPHEGTTAPAQVDPCSCLFFARAPPDATVDQLQALFCKYGTVKDINLYRRWPTAKQSKGCGTVQFADQESASAALQALNGIYKFPGLDTPLVVERLDPARQTKPPKQAAGKDASNTAKDQYRCVGSDGSTGVNPMTGSWSCPLPAGMTDPYTLPALLAMMSLEMLNMNAQAAAANITGNTAIPTAPQRRTWAGAYPGASMSQPGDISSWGLNNNPGFAARNRRSSCPNPGSFNLSTSAPTGERHSLNGYSPLVSQSAPSAGLTASQLLMLQQNEATPAQQGQLQAAHSAMPVNSALHSAVGPYGVSSMDGSYATMLDAGAAVARGAYGARDYMLSPNICNSFTVQTPQPTESLHKLSSLDSDMFTPTAAGTLACTDFNWALQQQQQDVGTAAATAVGVHGLAVNGTSGVMPAVGEQCLPLVLAAGRPDSTLAPPAALPLASNKNGIWQQQPQQQSQKDDGAEVVVRITPELLTAIGASLPHVATLSGANIQARAQAGVAGGLVLALTGTAAARDMASRLICAVVEQPLPAVQAVQASHAPMAVAASYVM